MMNTKRAFPSGLDDLHGPAKKRSFLGRDHGAVNNHVLSMSNDLRAIKVQLKQGLYHIGEALRLADTATADMYSIQPISDARDIIQRFVRTTVGSTIRKQRNRFPNSFSSNSGWNPMGSQFLPLGMLPTRGIEHGGRRGRGRGRGRDGRGRGGRGRFPGSVDSRSSKRGIIMKCDMCNVECNSLVQWEQH